MEDTKSITNTNTYTYTYDFIRKTLVNYTVIIFAVVIVLIFILLSLYYLTPNNYKFIKWDENKFKFENEIKYVIKPNSITNIDTNIHNKYLKFPKQTNLIVKNIFKSQNITIEDNNELIEIFNSNVFLINNENFEKEIYIQFYLLK